MADELQVIEDFVKKQAPGLLDKVPKQERPRLFRLMAQRGTLQITQAYSGPIPSPEQLAQFEQILPGLADRLVTMAEKQSHHRMGLEEHALVSQQAQSGRGQWMGFVIALVCVIGGVVLTLAGHETIGSTLAGGTVVTLTGIFVTGKYLQRKDLANKKPS